MIGLQAGLVLYIINGDLSVTRLEILGPEQKDLHWQFLTRLCVKENMIMKISLNLRDELAISYHRFHLRFGAG